MHAFLMPFAYFLALDPHKFATTTCISKWFRLFSRPYLSDFRLEHVPGIFEKKEVIKKWQDMQISGRLDIHNEVQLKSPFIQDIFGNVLGFQFDSDQWQLHEELKTEIDATRADAALGFFTIKNREQDNEVRIIVEAKKSIINLDEKQVNPYPAISPIEQAFLYSTKFSSYCRWIIVTNFTTIRFYHASYQGAYQLFELATLLDENELKTFLYLFQAERLIHSDDAPTDKLYAMRQKPIQKGLGKRHVLDEMYTSLYRFDELPFLEPSFIANLYPFNVLNERVWHYGNYELYTLNSEIHRLLNRIELNAGQISISPELQTEFKNELVTEAEQKILYVFEKLSNCLIFKIVCFADIAPIRNRYTDVLGFSLAIRFTFEPGEGLVKNIRYYSNKTCECSVCLRKSFNFKKLAKHLKSAEGEKQLQNEGNAYGNYLLLTNDFRSSYVIYKSLTEKYKNKSRYGISYFLAQLNLKILGDLMSELSLVDHPYIIEEIKEIDIDKVLYQQVYLLLDRDQLRYLQRIKDRSLFRLTDDHLSNLVAVIQQNKLELEQGTIWSSGFPDHTDKLNFYYYSIHVHHSGNFIIGDFFSDYSLLVGKYAEGLLLSYLLPTSFKSFSALQLGEFIWHIPSKKLDQLLSPINKIDISEKDSGEFLINAQNFLESNHKILFNRAIEDPGVFTLFHNYPFKRRYERVFINLFLTLTRLNVANEVLKPLTQIMIDHLTVSPLHYMPEVYSFAEFIEARGNIFTINQLIELLNLFIDHQQAHVHPFERLSSSVCKALNCFYSDFRYTDRITVNRLLANCIASNGYDQLNRLLDFWAVCDEVCRKILKDGIVKSLQLRFNYYLYQECLRYKMIRPEDNKSLFNNLIQTINTTNHIRFQGELDTHGHNNNYILVTFCLLLNDINYKLTLNDKSKIVVTNPYEKWLLDPKEFDYSGFNPKWLLGLEQYPNLLKSLNEHSEIATALEQYLSTDYDEMLAKLYFISFRN